MLNLICGGPGTGKTHRVYEAVKKDVEAAKRAYLVVPEQYALVAESTLAEILPPSAPLYFEVTNFSRLANTVFRAKGGLSYHYATKSTRLLFMWKTLTEALPLLKNGDAVDGGRVKKTLAALSELKAAGIGYTVLRKTAEQLPKKDRLRDKLTDISLIGTTYDEFLAEHYDDAEADLDRLAEILKDNAFFAGSHVYIDGFTSFTEQEYRIIKLIAETAELTVTLPLPEKADECLCYSEMQNTRKKLLGLAVKNGIPCNEGDGGLTVNRRAKYPALAYVTDNLWRTDMSRVMPLKDDAKGITLVTASEPYEAAEYVAADIRRRTDGGARLRDFAIVCHDADIYTGILDEALAKNGIAYYMAEKNDITAFAAIKMIYAAYAVVSDGYRDKDVIAYMKCGLSGLSCEECDKLEMYISTWHLSDEKKYLSNVNWHMHPKGYGQTYSEADEAMIATVNAAREKLCRPLSAFGKSVRTAVTALDHCRVLYDFLRSLSLPEQLAYRSEEVRRGIRAGDSACEARLFSVITEVLDDIGDAVGDEKTDLETFLQLLKLAFSEADIGTIPSSADAVTVGSADMLRVGNIANVYLFGMNEGEFPSPVSDNSNFSDSDKRVLCSLGLPLEPDLEIRSARELFSFLRAFSAASDNAVCVNFNCDAAFGAGMPSSAYNRIAALCPSAKRIVISEESPEIMLYAADASLEKTGSLSGTEIGNALLRALPDTPEKQRVAEVASSAVTESKCRLSEDTADKVYGKAFTLTQSKLERFLDCPMSYLCTDVLHLSEDLPAEIGYRDIGNFVHGILEHLLKEYRVSGNNIGDATKEEVENAVKRAADAAEMEAFSPDMPRSARLQHHIDVLRRRSAVLAEELRTEFAQSQYRPLACELPIDEKEPVEGDTSKLTSTVYTLPNNTRLSLRGKIDRVDVYENDTDCYFRVVDYKTGSKEFKFSDLEKGRDLQMLIYLFALCGKENEPYRHAVGVDDSKKITPAGMLYMRTGVNDISGERQMTEEEVLTKAHESITRFGVLLSDTVSLNAMDKEASGHYGPFVRNISKSGEPSLKPAKSTTLCTEEEMNRLKDNLRDTVTGIGFRIRQGESDASPCDGGRNVCESCAMKAVCRRMGKGEENSD